MSNILKSLVLISSIFALGACGDNLNSNSRNTNVQTNSMQLQFKLNNIEPMAGQHYEGWAITSSGVVSTGRFNVDSNSNIFSVNAQGQNLGSIGQNNTYAVSVNGNTNSINAFVLTIEPDGDTDTGPSSIHYLEGNFTNGKTVAVTSGGGALGASFLSSLGTYFLATPTNGPSTHNQGIWYLNAGQPSLQLPTLNTGWVYEGWVVNTSTGEVISTGTFSSATGADSDGPGATAGPNPAPGFPGQDFINPARVLNNGNYRAVISVEPQPDFDPSPFTLKILAHDIANGAPITTPIALDNISNESTISMEATFL